MHCNEASTLSLNPWEIHCILESLTSYTYTLRFASPYSCIEKWLRNTGGGKCPQCNCKAKRGDIRVIYAKAIAVLDTTERDAAVKALQEEKQLRIQAMRDEAQALLGQNLARSECDRLKEEIERLRSTLSVYTSGSGTEQASSVESLPASVAPSAEDEPVAPVRKAGGRYSLLNSIHISQVCQDFKIVRLV